MNFPGYSSSFIPNLLKYELLKCMVYSKFAPGTQLDVQFLESQVYSNSRKFEIISSLVTEEHDYLSLAVCRNPIEKLLSVYQVLKDPRVGRTLTSYQL